MHPNPVVRVATIADLPAVCQLAEDLAVTHHEAWPSVFAPPSGSTRDEWHWRESLVGESRIGFVAEAGGAVIAFIALACHTESHSLFQSTRFARINSVCVAEQMRGKGVGRSLMSQAESWAAEHGANEVRLIVWAFNKAAIQMYEELGYEVRSHTMAKALERAGT
jgi:GNAT superfamily N-acetyltransferase